MKNLFPSAFDFHIKDFFTKKPKEEKQDPLPVEFPGFNTTYAKDQPEYIPLPVFRFHDGQVTSCWKFNWENRLRILFGGRVYLTQHTFNQPLQPQRLHMDFGWDTVLCKNCGEAISLHKAPEFTCPKQP